MRDTRNVSFDFSDQVVLITGAARGQGRSHALAFAEAGAKVIACDIGHGISSVPYDLGTPEELEQLGHELEDLGVECLTRLCDVSKPDEVQELVAASTERFGQIDILVNNAGIASIYSVQEMPIHAWDEMIATNLSGQFYCVKFVAPGMLEQRRGKIVNVASTAGLHGAANLSHYVAAKHGLIGLTRAAAWDLGPHGVNVNAVCPTDVDTEMLNGLKAEHGDYFDAHPDRKFLRKRDEQLTRLSPQEITQAVMWLCSDAADYVTGISLTVDSGELA